MLLGIGNGIVARAAPPVGMRIGLGIEDLGRDAQATGTEPPAMLSLLAVFFFLRRASHGLLVFWRI